MWCCVYRRPRAFKKKISCIIIKKLFFSSQKRCELWFQGRPAWTTLVTALPAPVFLQTSLGCASHCCMISSRTFCTWEHMPLSSLTLGTWGVGGIERLDYLLNYIQTANEVSIPGSQECDCVAVFNLGVVLAAGVQIQGLPLANQITVSVC